MAKAKPVLPRAETVREWLDPAKGDRVVTRQELIFWLQEYERAKRAASWAGRLDRAGGSFKDAILWLPRWLLDQAHQVFGRRVEVGKGEV